MHDHRGEISGDTSSAARRVQIEVLRRMGPEGRSRMAAELSRNVLNVTRQGIRDRHPDYTPEEIHHALLKITLGEELYQLAYPGRTPDSP